MYSVTSPNPRQFDHYLDNMSTVMMFISTDIAASRANSPAVIANRGRIIGLWEGGGPV